MVERGEGPKFPIGAPDEIKAAPDFSGGDRSSSPEQDLTVPESVIAENQPTAETPTLERAINSTEPISVERAGILSVSDIGETLPTQKTIEGIFEAGSESE